MRPTRWLFWKLNFHQTIQSSVFLATSYNSYWTKNALFFITWWFTFGYGCLKCLSQFFKRTAIKNGGANYEILLPYDTRQEANELDAPNFLTGHWRTRTCYHWFRINHHSKHKGKQSEHIAEYSPSDSERYELKRLMTAGNARWLPDKNDLLDIKSCL